MRILKRTALAPGALALGGSATGLHTASACADVIGHAYVNDNTG